MGAIEDIDKAARNGVQLSIELVALFGETLSKLFNDLATASQRASKDLQDQLRRTTYGALTDATVAGEQLQGQAEQLTTQAQATFDQTRDQMLQGLQLPTLASITQMRAQLDRLDKDVTVLEMSEILPNYPELHADEAIALVPQQENWVLLALQRYERQQDDRVTVLRAIERELVERSLHGGETPEFRTTVEPVPHYDDFTAEQIKARIESLSTPELVHVRAYELDHKARVTVIGAAEARLYPGSEQ